MLNQTFGEVYRQGKVTAEPPLEVVPTAGGLSIRMVNGGFWAELTSGGGPYGWREVMPDGTGGFTVLTGGRSGTTTSNPAYEINQTNPALGTVVWLSPGVGTEYLFDESCGCTGNGLCIDVVTASACGNSGALTYTTKSLHFLGGLLVAIADTDCSTGTNSTTGLTTSVCVGVAVTCDNGTPALTLDNLHFTNGLLTSIDYDVDSSVCGSGSGTGTGTGGGGSGGVASLGSTNSGGSLVSSISLTGVTFPANSEVVIIAGGCNGSDAPIISITVNGSSISGANGGTLSGPVYGRIVLGYFGPTSGTGTITASFSTPCVGFLEAVAITTLTNFTFDVSGGSQGTSSTPSGSLVGPPGETTTPNVIIAGVLVAQPLGGVTFGSFTGGFSAGQSETADLSGVASCGMIEGSQGSSTTGQFPFTLTQSSDQWAYVEAAFS